MKNTIKSLQFEVQFSGQQSFVTKNMFYIRKNTSARESILYQKCCSTQGSPVFFSSPNDQKGVRIIMQY